jgi:hypothetical protein
MHGEGLTNVFCNFYINYSLLTLRSPRQGPQGFSSCSSTPAGGAVYWMDKHFLRSSNSSPGAILAEGRCNHLFSLLTLLVMEMFSPYCSVYCLWSERQIRHLSPEPHASIVVWWESVRKVVIFSWNLLVQLCFGCVKGRKYPRFGTINQELPSRRLVGRVHKTHIWAVLFL